MKWETDLIKDIRWHDPRDDDNYDKSEIVRLKPFDHDWQEEFSQCNRENLTKSFLSLNKPRAILEIGVCRNNEKSSTYCFLNNKNDDTVYIGIDIVDKSFLNNPNKNIHTIKNRSCNYDENIEKFKELGITEFDYIFIDGWHDINQVLRDWEYTNLLAPNGIVGFHDTSDHPGPYWFMRALNTDIWDVEENTCCSDHGIGFVRKKIKE
jgi:hypothetical protein